MNAIDLLEQDHRIVDGLFKEVENTPPSRHPALFKRIKGELDTHAHVEEVIFYPALKKRGKKDLVDSVLEGVEEHGQMKKFLKELASLTPQSETYEPKLKVLIEDTRHHVKEEERLMTGMFAMAKDQLGTETLENLGQQMDVEKKKYQAKNNIKPEPRVEAKGTLGALVEKAKEMVDGIFATGEATAGKARNASASNGSRSNGKAATKKTAAAKTTTAKSATRAKSTRTTATPSATSGVAKRRAAAK